MKIECEICHQVGYLQQLGNYYRVRHYSGINTETGKSKFQYHQQSKSYVSSKVTFKNENTVTLEELKIIDHSNSGLDLKVKDSGSNICGRRLVWFRTLAFQANDPGFKSRRPHHIIQNVSDIILNF
jgi:hypothetical protein